MAITKEEAIKRDLKKLGVFVYKKDGDTVFFKKDITAALKKLKVNLINKPEFLNKTTLFLVYKNQSIIIFLIMLLPSFVSFTK